MAIVVPNGGEVQALLALLSAQNLFLRLYSNNVTPDETSTVASFTQVAGGGYAQITLSFLDWSFTPGNPSYASQNQRTFNFTGVTNAPGTIYGYYLTDLAGTLFWAERFPSSVLPFTPVAGSRIRITPRLECS